MGAPLRRVDQDAWAATAGDADAARRKRARRSWWLVLAVVWLVLGAYALYEAPRGWIPHDEGTLGQSAERVLRGELPHVGYDEPYTGGVSLLHAAAFRAFGVSVLTMRITVWVFFLASVPATYYIATRIARPVAAGAVTLLSGVWSVPTYVSGMPSWYNTLFALYGLAALFAHLENGKRRWLFAAGVFGGLSILAKITGLYFVAAALLVILHRERRLAAGHPAAQPAEGAMGGLAYRAAVAVGLLVFLASVVLLFHARLGAAEAFHFVAPTLALVSYLLVSEWQSGTSGSRGRRAARLLWLVAPFVAGAALPLALFALPYLLAHSLDTLVRGVLIVPSRGAALAQAPLPPISTIVTAVPAALMLMPVLPGWRHPRAPLLRLAAVAVLLFVYLLGPPVHHTLLASARVSVPLLALAAAGALLGSRGGVPDVRQEQLFAAASVAVLCSFIQFPYAGYIYFYYAAPFVPLLALALLHGRPALHPWAPGVVVGLYAAVCVVLLTPNGTWKDAAVTSGPAAGLGRLRIRTSAADRATYAALTAVIRRRAGRSEYVFAEPECPELHFLSATRSPTRNVFSDLGDPVTRTARTMAMLHERNVRVAVVNHRPIHFSELPADLVQALRSEYPNSNTVGKYEIRWRD